MRLAGHIDGARHPRAALRGAMADPLLRSAYSLILNVVLTSVLGVGFWIVAARLYPSATLGRDGALVSAMLVVSTVCQLNFSSVILRFLPIIKLPPARAVLGAYALTAAASLIGGAAFVLIAPRVSASYRFLSRDAVLSVFYVLAVAAWGVFALQDSVLTAMRRAPWVPLENGAFGVLKVLALPILLALGSTHAVFIAWMVPMVLLVIPVNWVIFMRIMPRRVAPESELSPVERFGRRGLARFMVNDYVGTIFIQAGSTLLPVVVVGLVGNSRGAYFYVAFTITSAFDLLFVNIAASMTVEASLARARLRELVISTCRRFTPLLVLGVAVLIGGASLILLPYGPVYVHSGAPVLRLLAAASLFRAVTSLYVAVCRVEGRAGRGMALQGVLLVMTLGLTFTLARHQRVVSVGYAWFIANAVVGLAVLPHVLRLIRRPREDGPLGDPDAGRCESEFLLITVTGSDSESKASLAVLLDSLGTQEVSADLVLVMRGGGEVPAAPQNVRVHPVVAPERIALSDARNRALRFAGAHGLLSGEATVAFPDDDASYPEGLLGTVLAARRRGIELVTGPYAPTAEAVNWQRFPRTPRELTPGLVMRAVSSNTVFMSAAAVQRVGLFDERLGLGAPYGAGEDSDYVLRALAAGFAGRYEPSLVIRHPYKAHRAVQYYPGNVAVLAKHARRPGTRVLLARRLVSGALMTLGRRIALSQYLSATVSAVRLIARG